MSYRVTHRDAEVVVDVPSSRILLRPSDLDRSRRFYRDALGLAIYREFGPRRIPAWCSSSARDCSRSRGTVLRVLLNLLDPRAARAA